MQLGPPAAIATLALSFGLLTAGPAIAATAWSPPVDLSVTGEDAEAPQLATSADGRFAVAAWLRGTQVQSASYQDGIWSPTLDLGGDAENLDLAVSSDGSTAWLVWQRDGGANDTIRAARWQNGAWGASQSVESALCCTFRRPSVATSADGATAVVAYEKGDDEISAKRYTAGAWGAAQSVESGNPASTSTPQVTMSAGGTRAAVAWTQDSDVHARVWNNAALSDTQILANGADSPVVRMAADGTTAHTVWRGAGNQTQWSRLTGNIWSPAAAISGPNTEQPDISVSDNGQAMAVWDADSGLQARFWDGSAWGTVATMGSTSIHQPSVSLTSDGIHAAAAWYDSSGATYIVSSALWSAGQWAAPTTLSAPGGNATEPVVAVAGTGPVGFAAWRRKDPGFDVVQVSNLLASPSAPLAPVASADVEQATVSWQPPAANGNSPITGYTVTAAPGGATCTTPTTMCTVPGLTNGTSYTFTVTAANAIGVSPPSVASNAVIPVPDKPGKVKKLKVKATKATKVKVTWKKAARATSYQVKLSKPGGKKFPGAWRSTKKQAVTLKVKTGKRYAVKVRGRNLGGTGPATKVRFRT